MSLNKTTKTTMRSILEKEAPIDQIVYQPKEMTLLARKFSYSCYSKDVAMMNVDTHPGMLNYRIAGITGGN